MADFSDLRSRVFYGVPIALIGLACLLTKLTTAILIAILLVGFIFEIVDKLRKNSTLSAKAFWVTAVFASVGITGFACAFAIRISKHGFCDLLLVALGVTATDIFAYVGGKKFGHTKLAPKISPNKTIEGVFCGIIAGMAVLLATWGVLRASNNTSLSPNAILCAMLVPPIAVLADLLKSKSKRLLGVKDFGKTLGAHGGIADRFDALTAGFVVMWLVILIVS